VSIINSMYRRITNSLVTGLVADHRGWSNLSVGVILNHNRPLSISTRRSNGCVLFESWLVVATMGDWKEAYRCVLDPFTLIGTNWAHNRRGTIRHPFQPSRVAQLLSAAHFCFFGYCGFIRPLMGVFRYCRFHMRRHTMSQCHTILYTYNTYNSVYLTCSKKLTDSQLSLPHGTKKNVKEKTKNKLMSVISVILFCLNLRLVKQRNLNFEVHPKKPAITYVAS